MQRYERHLIWALLALSTVLGIVFATITPLWSNVEEPTHFEYIRFIVDHHRLPEPGDADPVVQQRIVEAFVWAHSEWGLGGRMFNGRVRAEWDINEPADWQRVREALSPREGYEDLTNRTRTSTEQFGEAPGYYLIAALPQFLLSGASIEAQFMAARLVSVLLGVLTVWLSALAAREIFPDRWTLRIAAPALVALQPSFVVIQSSINNTIAAAAALALVVYAIARWVRRGFSLSSLLLIGAAGAACLLSKTTAYAGAAALVLALPMARRTAWPRWVRIALSVAAVLVVVLTFSWQGPSSWYPISNRAQESEEAPVGEKVLYFWPGEGISQTLWQVLPPETVQQLRGQTLTLGAWMRSVYEPIDVQMPGVWAAPNEGTLTLLTPQAGSMGITPLAPMWSFHAVTITVPSETQCMAVRLSAEGDATSMSARIYDGLVLAVGERPLDEPPTFDDAAGTSGIWGGEPFDNLLLNGSVEQRQPLPRPGLIPDTLPLADTPVRLSMNLATFYDVQANATALSQSLRWLFSSFWSRFGWTNPGLPVWAIGGLALLTAVSLAGQVWYAAWAGRRTPLWQRRTLALTALVGVAVLGVAIFRLDPIRLPLYCDFYQGRFISTGYYIVPGMLPLMLMWYLGLEAWLPERWHRWLLAGMVLLFFGLTMGMLFGRIVPNYLSVYGVDVPNTLLRALWS